MQTSIKNFIEKPFFSNFVIGLILFNAVTFGLETSKDIMASYGHILLTIDKIILFIFVIELSLKIFAYRLSFFKSGWNIFDFTIVAVCLLPATGPLAIMRALRIFRLLRLFSVVPQMRPVVSGLIKSLPGMASVVGVIVVVFFISSVMATKLYGQSGDPTLENLFGSLNKSMFTLFQLMTLEDWVDAIVQPAMDVYPMSWLFFIPFIIITSFAILNLFIGVIVESMQSVYKTEIESADNVEKARSEKANQELLAEIKSLRADVEKIRDGLNRL